MYVYCKPFTAGGNEAISVGGLGEKSVLLIARVLGYLRAKLVGIRGVNGMSVLIADNRRAFFTSIGVAAGGIGLLMVSLALNSAGGLGASGSRCSLGWGCTCRRWRSARRCSSGCWR